MIRDISEVSWPGWETVGVLGRGSFGAVYEIRRDVLGETEKAALKVISIPQSESEIQELYNDGYDNESVAETFQAQLKNIVNEYSMMRRMNDCANVVHCDDVRYEQKADGLGWDIYIKMELLTPLAQALPDEISESTVIQVGKDMCNALILCAKHNIVHRDIKPQNMFISPNGTYKLGDFGVAKTVERTMGGTKIGTFKYMAPEVYHSNPYGVSADIYSLGLVLYWMLNYRRMPFMPLPPAKVMGGMDGDAANRRLAGEQIPSPANGSEELKRIVLKACAFDAKDRYKSAEEMLFDLENIGRNVAPIIVPEPTVMAKIVEPVAQPKNIEETVRVRQAVSLPDNTYRARPVANRPVISQQPVLEPEEIFEKPSVKKVFLLSVLMILCAGVLAVITWIISAPPRIENSTKNDTVNAEKNNDSGNIKVGDVITFGSYEQDNNSYNGKEPIEWQVLDIQDGKALVISQYALDCQPFNSSFTDVTWETCSLRRWLNIEFVNLAFTSIERDWIPQVTVSEAYNSEYNTNPGNPTQDELFLLSIAEVKKYLGTNDARVCKVTEYAKAKGATQYGEVGSCWWWLRSTGGEEGAPGVSHVSGFGEVALTILNDGFAIRPAMWIDLNGL